MFRKKANFLSLKVTYINISSLCIQFMYTCSKIRISFGHRNDVISLKCRGHKYNERVRKSMHDE